MMIIQYWNHGDGIWHILLDCATYWYFREKQRTRLLEISTRLYPLILLCPTITSRIKSFNIYPIGRSNIFRLNSMPIIIIFYSPFSGYGFSILILLLWAWFMAPSDLTFNLQVPQSTSQFPHNYYSYDNSNHIRIYAVRKLHKVPIYETISLPNSILFSFLKHIMHLQVFFFSS